ncbi:DUF952 domain-containing protein [Hymenobacter sp. BT635]|uniref:DUF952 domain-containing protein n=1 Tax=Hymenobacter nitidus TaxID=2880929 RepID=A0ABS8AAF6_9BACT|nr:DUF952 domain-containing protein [Hymenobacter nitidus]MCB2377383.1 DUF952 domain-containing protein [Hymenobacter nitidus]
MSPAAFLYRIADQSDWDRAQQTGFFASPDLANEGFIHCSHQTQILETARRYYAGRRDMVLLEIDEARLLAAGVRVEREWVQARGQAFAHVFGPIPLTAIIRPLPFQPGADGAFALPAELAGSRQPPGSS